MADHERRFVGWRGGKPQVTQRPNAPEWSAVYSFESFDEAAEYVEIMA